MTFNEIEAALETDREAIVNVLKGLANECGADVGWGEIDVRLQWHDGSWSLHSGDSSYDQDHRGYWGSSGVDAESDCTEVAKDLISQVLDMAADNESSNT